MRGKNVKKSNVEKEGRLRIYVFFFMTSSLLSPFCSHTLPPDGQRVVCFGGMVMAVVLESTCEARSPRRDGSEEALGRKREKKLPRNLSRVAPVA